MCSRGTPPAEAQRSAMGRLDMEADSRLAKRNLVGNSHQPGRVVFGFGTGHGQIAVWNLHTGALLKQFDDDICAGNLAGAPSTLFSHVDFSPDGTRLVDAGGGACATIWNWQQVSSSQPVFSGSDGVTINSIAFNADGSRAVLAGNDGKAMVWNLATGAAQVTFEEQGDNARRGDVDGIFHSRRKRGRYRWHLGRRRALECGPRQSGAHSQF